MRVIRNLFALGIALSLASTTLAHHSAAIYDLGNQVTFDGVVTDYEWAYPHVYLFVEAVTDTGDPVVWAVETGPPAAMTRAGWSRDTFAAGDPVSMTISPARDRSRNVALVRLVQRGGVTLFDMRGLTGALNAPSSGETSGLAGTWAHLYLPIFGQFYDAPWDRSAWQLTEKGVEAADAYREETTNPEIECTLDTAPMSMVYPGVQQIEIGEEFVSIRSDTVQRTVHMNADSHEGAAVTLQGRSIGWWEDGVLVVDTTHFAEHRTGNTALLPSGSQKHLVERFELNPDGMSLTYRFELDDPEYLTAPFTGELEWAHRPDLELVPLECDHENARRFLGD